MLCPSCGSSLSKASDTEAVCSQEGIKFRVLFSRAPGLAEGGSPPPVDNSTGSNEELVFEEPSYGAPPGSVCKNHPALAAGYVCNQCGATLCATCTFFLEDRSTLCPTCYVRPRPPAGATCSRHPGAQASSFCMKCGTPVCPTCEFAFPGNIYMCPACATAPQDALSGGRKKLLVGSLIAAAIATAGYVMVFSGALAGAARTQEEETVMGVLFMLISLVPSLAGFGMGITAIRKGVRTHPLTWVAIVWNALLAAGFFLLVILGSSMR